MRERISESTSFRAGGSAALSLRVHWPGGIWGISPRAGPALHSGSQQMALGLSQLLLLSLSRRKRLLHWSEAARRGAELGAAAAVKAAATAVKAAATAAEHRVGPRAMPRAGRPGPEAGRGPVRRPLSRGGEETQGDQEEEQERVKERRRSGRRGRRRAEPARPCPAQPAGGRDQPGGPTLAFRFTYAQGAVQRPGCAAPAWGKAGAAAALRSAPGAASREGGM